MKRRRAECHVGIRLAGEAHRLKVTAETLPAGEEHGELLRKAVQAYAAVE
jgi:hypothetical protein